VLTTNGEHWRAQYKAGALGVASQLKGDLTNLALCAILGIKYIEVNIIEYEEGGHERA
jgi:hypothetical protein